MDRLRTICLRSLVLGTIPGTLVSGGMMYIAWRHNPQGAFHGTDGVHWVAWLSVGALWFLPVMGFTAFIVAIAWSTANWIARYAGRGSNRAGARD